MSGPPAGHLVTAAPGKRIELAGPEEPIRRLQRILIPIDFSDASLHALSYGVAFAQQFGAEISLLSVLNDNPTSFEYGNLEYQRLIDSGRRACQAHLEEVRTQQVPATIPAQTLTRTGRPFEVIVKTAQESQSDLIIMATHTRKERPDGYLASTTERVLRYATCPVLVVRFPQRDFLDFRPMQLQAARRDAEAATELGNSIESLEQKGTT